MWCDDFDLDLPLVVPEAMRSVFSVPPDATLRTFGQVTDGRLNHPACWNTRFGPTAFFTLDPHDRPAPAGYANGGQEVVTCTFVEAVRDAWAHKYVMVVDGHVVWDMTSTELLTVFNGLLYHGRGLQEVSAARVVAFRRHVVTSLEAASERMVRLVAERQVREAAAAAGFGAER